ncbi:MAG: LecA/PA-IL family lectin [Cyanobacteria bacterium P01_H01_bin.21]
MLKLNPAQRNHHRWNSRFSWKLKSFLKLGLVLVSTTIPILGIQTAANAEVQRVRICNNAPESVGTIEVAIGYWTGGRLPEKIAVPDTATEGWWHIEPGDCVNINPEERFLLHVEFPYLYYYARTSNGQRVWDGDYPLCVSRSAFRLLTYGVGDQESCRGRGNYMQNFRRERYDHNAERLTLNLNARIRSSRISVNARSRWVDTGIDLAAGQRLSVRANGTWTNGGENPQRLGPQGFENFTLDSAEMPSKNFAGLIGRVGNRRFFIGDGGTGESPGSGRLYLQINDIPGTLNDNSGTLNVEVDY